MTLTREQLSTKLQTFRLAPNKNREKEVFQELLQAAGTIDICGLLLQCVQGEEDLGELMLVEVLNTIQGPGHEDQSLDLVTSPSLRQLLGACKGVKNTTAKKLLLEIIYESHKKKDNICADLRVEVVLFCGGEIVSEAIGLSDVACKLATSIIRSCEDKEETNALLREFHQVAASSIKNTLDASSSVLRTRYCSMIASILGTENRDDLFQACLASGAARQILDLCEDKSDPLLQMNALELLAEFGGTEAGFKYIQETGTLLKLLRMAQPESEENDPLLGPEALAALSAVFHRALSCSVLTSVGQDGDRIVPIFVETMITNIESDSEHARIAGLNAIVEFASSSYGACKYVSENDKAVETIVGLLKSPKQEMKIAALYGLAEMVGCEFHSHDASTRDVGETVFQESAITMSDIEATSASLFDKIGKMTPGGQDTLGFLLDILRQPFSEVRIPALMVIKAAASFGYGIQILFHSTKAKMFRDFLNRHSEMDKQSKEAKYEIIANIANSTKFGLLSEENQRFITTAKSRGPFYVPPAMAEPRVI